MSSRARAAAGRTDMTLTDRPPYDRVAYLLKARPTVSPVATSLERHPGFAMPVVFEEEKTSWQIQQ